MRHCRSSPGAVWVRLPVRRGTPRRAREARRGALEWRLARRKRMARDRQIPGRSRVGGANAGHASSRAVRSRTPRRAQSGDGRGPEPVRRAWTTAATTDCRPGEERRSTAGGDPAFQSPVRERRARSRPDVDGGRRRSRSPRNRDARPSSGSAPGSQRLDARPRATQQNRAKYPKSNAWGLARRRAPACAAGAAGGHVSRAFRDGESSRNFGAL